ncbi:RES domain-containing protein [Halomonas campisalis]|uniref:RES domain-containing protein n=1 Tax=Billgrantia campisalis TaxID=74661 RepID=A0ABS9P934_9GAMM|nr:RES domain-containing protein [Halomonas campisalis]MCG6658263.1 RES domain-containing protein [Halomonas campisalis]MDR5862933.1 RES domain-containing protein [Halomonas campisalis]
MAERPDAGDLCLWRLERKRHLAGWDSGIGAELAGGRWNSKGRAAVYGSLDPSTAILEVAAHKGFKALDTLPHVLLCARILAPERAYRVTADSLPNPNWLIPGSPGQGQQSYGDWLLNQHPFLIVPSTVSRYSWNIVMNPVTAEGLYDVVLEEPFALDTRLNPPRS